MELLVNVPLLIIGFALLVKGADVFVDGVALELARANLEEGYAAAVVGVHVGVDLEYEAAEVLVLGVYDFLVGDNGFGGGGNLDEAVEELLDAEGVEG